MSQKRNPDEGRAPRPEGTNSDDKRRKIPNFRNVVLEVMKLHTFERSLEPLIRRVVKEEVEIALKKHLNNMKQNGVKEMHSTVAKSLKLRFLNNISLPVFTGARIEGEEGFPLQVALVDCFTGQIIYSGPESTAKVEVVVLEGDFDGDEGDNWTVEEFKNNIVREREGKKPLLTGDAVLNLKDGEGSVGEISFTDNSSWTRSRRFRLGVRVVDNFDGVEIREAKTESFIVRDHRGELYKKHHPPSLYDEVWRLEKIGKDGAFHKRLTREKILTVKDFLTLLFLDPQRLRNILGTGMSAKMWEVTVEHARTCVLEKSMFLYIPSNSQHKTGVVFNIVGQLLGQLSDGQYVSIDKLSETEKADAHNMLISAFEHWEEVVSFDDEASLTAGSALLTNVLYTSSSPKIEGSAGSKFLASHKIGAFDYIPPSSASSPDIMSSIYSVGGTSSLEDYALHTIDSMDLRFDQALNFPSQVSTSLICDSERITQAFCDEDHLQFFDTDLQTQSMSLESPADLQSAVDGFRFPRSTLANGKAQRRWTKLVSVLKWFLIMMSLKRTHISRAAQGHINPLLQFAKILASKGLKATLATTHYTLKSITTNTTTTTTAVGFEPISDGYDGGGFELASSLEAYLESFRAMGSKTLTELIMKFSETDCPVTCVVYDCMLTWVIDVVRQFGIVGVVFMTNSASVCSLYCRLNRGELSFPVEKGKVISTIKMSGLPPLGFSEMPSFLAQPGDLSPYLALIMEMFQLLDGIDWAFCNSFQQLETELMEAMVGLWPLKMVGPMVPSAYLDQQIKGDTSYGASLWKPTSYKYLRWLDTKPQHAVIYVSFGSMASLSAKQVEEIAWGLKSSQRPFLWVLKEPEKKLPKEFLSSIGEGETEAGIVVTWCDQLEVLAHQAVGCFLTHCGWNSTLEGLSLAVPMVGVPQWSDQPMNAKFVEEVWGVGVWAKRNDEGIVMRGEIERSVREVMGGEKSGEIKRNALKWREAAVKAISTGGTSYKNIDGLVEFLKAEKNRG
ncbi:hypothetical protein F8388_012281 [Cannabis sativa]|uniref:Uncharacterized protein n=2 Tax=Cannabis sativa TaxID=3483 RepID=A0A7J6ECW0_CANSA|nr:hypothetical protein F8388_012281 [Cannabis sativa]